MLNKDGLRCPMETRVQSGSNGLVGFDLCKSVLYIIQNRRKRDKRLYPIVREGTVRDSGGGSGSTRAAEF